MHELLKLRKFVRESIASRGIRITPHATEVSKGLKYSPEILRAQPRSLLSGVLLDIL